MSAQNIIDSVAPRYFMPGNAIGERQRISYQLLEVLRQNNIAGERQVDALVGAAYDRARFELNLPPVVASGKVVDVAISWMAVVVEDSRPLAVVVTPPAPIASA